MRVCKITSRGENTLIFKVKNKVFAEISRNKCGAYHCFLKTSPRGGLSADYPDYNKALQVAADYVASFARDGEQVYFEYNTVTTVL